MSARSTMQNKPRQKPQQGRPVSTTLKQIEDCQQANSANPTNDLLLMLYSHLIGSTVEVTVRNGTKFVGICHTVFPDGELGVILTKARKLPGKADAGKQTSGPVIEMLIIEPKDCVDVKATDIDLWYGTASKSTTSSPDGFKTDTAISGQFGEVRERTLQKWTPDDGIDVAIEDDMPTRGAQRNLNGTHWNQFEVNERLFGLKTNFDEELYTTKLDRDSPDFKAREQKAIQIAREIESSVSRNPHIAEERGQKYDDSGLDEEDKYSGVKRESEANKPSSSNLLAVPLTAPSSSLNKYMPPAMRARQQHNLAKSAEFSPAAAANPPASTPAAPTALTPVLRQRHELGNRKVEVVPDTVNRKNDNTVRLRGNENQDIEKRVAELKAFSKEFKLLTPMPEDLIPIISGPKAPKPAEKEENNKTAPIASSSSSKSKTFKFNVQASEFKPSTTITSTPGTVANHSGTVGPSESREDNFWAGDHRRTKHGNNRDHRFNGKPWKRYKGPPQPPNAVAPTWPYGHQPFRRQFYVTNHYDGSEMYPDYNAQAYAYQYGAPGYRYPNQGYLPPGQMAMQGPIPPYVNPGQFYPNMPFAAPMQHGGPPHMYNNLPPGPPPSIYPKGQSPIIPEQSQYYPPPPPPHSYASPPPRGGGAPMVPAGGMPPQMYSPYPNSPHYMMHAAIPPNGMAMPPPGPPAPPVPGSQE